MTTSATTLTAGEIAQFIQRPDESLGAAIARFRNWEKTGIIKATGDANPGTGHRKQYRASALFEAILLQEISDQLGTPAIALAPLIEKLSEIVKAGAYSPKEVIVLGGISGGGEYIYNIDMVRTKDLSSYISKSKFNVNVVLNLRGMFDKAIPYFHDDLEIPDWLQRIARALSSKKLLALAAARREHELAEKEKNLASVAARREHELAERSRTKKPKQKL